MWLFKIEAIRMDEDQWDPLTEDEEEEEEEFW